MTTFVYCNECGYRWKVCLVAVCLHLTLVTSCWLWVHCMSNHCRQKLPCSFLLFQFCWLNTPPLNFFPQSDICVICPVVLFYWIHSIWLIQCTEISLTISIHPLIILLLKYGWKLGGVCSFWRQNLAAFLCILANGRITSQLMTWTSVDGVKTKLFRSRYLDKAINSLQNDTFRWTVPPIVATL